MAERYHGENVNDKEIVSESYREFRNPPKFAGDTFYDKAARACGRMLKIDTKSKRVVNAINFCHLNIEPRDVASLTVLAMLMSMLPLIASGIGMAIKFEIDILLAASLSIAGIAASYYIYTHPLRMKKRYEMIVGSDMISAILYMVIYMRNTPSLEGAVEFAGQNTKGGMAVELRKLLWDVRVGNYLTIEDGLMDYAEKWKSNKEFGESVGLVINATRQGGERFQSLLDEAVRLILSGNMETSQNYVMGLKMPLMAVNALGLILPVMGLVLFPVVSIFLKVGPVPLLVLYDIILPIMLFFLTTSILEKRPVTFSKIDVSIHPKLPPAGKFYIGNKLISAAAVALLAGIVIGTFAIMLYSAGLECTAEGNEGAIEKEVCKESDASGLFVFGGTAILSFSVLSALLFTLAITLAPGVYFLLLSRGRSKIREDIRSIEGEFREALFQLGTRMRSGIPVEKAMIESLEKMEGLKIRDFFSKAVHNMQRFSMTFENAFFDKKQGAIRYYPSSLIESIMKVITESAKKGPANAGAAMLSISHYLKDLHKTQEFVQRSMSNVTNAIKFQAYVLTPLISGVIATMAIVIIRILSSLNLQQSGLGGGAGGIPSLPMGLGFGAMVITPFEFVMVVSIFVAESLFIYGYLLSGIEVGEDEIKRSETLSGMFLVSPVVYAFITMVTLLIFGPMTQFNV